MTFLKTDPAKLSRRNEAFMRPRVITAEQSITKKQKCSFLSVFVRQILLKNQTKKPSFSYTKKSL